MKAELYQNGEQVATIEAPPYDWEYDGDDERLLSVLKAAERLTDWGGSGRVRTGLTATSGPEREVEATPGQRFRTAVAQAEDLGYFVASANQAKAAAASEPPAVPEAATERVRNLWKELINRAYTRLDARLSIQAGLVQADWNPALHPRGPDGKFVKRPWDVPESIMGLSTGSILRELADEDPDFAEKVEDLGIDGVLDVDESLDEALERLDDGESESIPEERLSPELSRKEMRDLPDKARILVNGDPGEYVTQNRQVISYKDENGDFHTVDKRPDLTVRRIFEEQDGGSPGENRSSGVDTVPWGDPIDPEDIDEGQWIAWDMFGNRGQMQVTSVEEDFNGNTLVNGERLNGKEKTIRPGRVKGDLRTSEPMEEYPDVGLSWPDDPEARTSDIRDSLDSWVPLGEDAVHPSADKKSIGPQQADQIKDFLADGLATAKDPETANRTIGTMIELGNSVSRAYDGTRGTVGDADRGGIIMDTISEDTAKHELGHRIGKAFGMKGQDNRLAKNYRHSFPTASDYGFTARSGADPASKYAFSSPDGGSVSAWGRDVWEDKVDAEVGEGLDGRNFSSVPEGWDPEVGEMVRFEQNPVAGMGDDSDVNQNWKVTGFDPDADSGVGAKGVVTLENWAGDELKADVKESPASDTISFKSKSLSDTEGSLPDLAGRRTETPENWGMFDKDPDEYLGSGPVSDDVEERFEELAVRVNEAWYRQAKLGATIDKKEGEMSVIISAYSATNAHETLARLHEVMQADRTPYEMDKSARALTQYHPELLEAYRHVFDIGNPEMIEALNDRLEQADAEFRFGDQ